MVNKLKDGTIELQIDKSDLVNLDSVELGFQFYNNEMFWSDLYINQIDGYSYIVDFNQNKIYDLPYYCIEMFFEELGKGKMITIAPYSEEVANDLFQILENGY